MKNNIKLFVPENPKTPVMKNLLTLSITLLTSLVKGTYMGSW